MAGRPPFLCSLPAVPFCSLCVYGGFAHPKLSGRSPHRGLVFYDVKGQSAGPLLHVFLHPHNTLLFLAVPHYLYVWDRRDIR